MKILTIAALCGFSLVSTGLAQTTIIDNFDDGSISTNTHGTGSGFRLPGTAAPSESGGFANFNTGNDGNTVVIQSNDTLNPFQVGQWTTTQFTFGSINIESGNSLDRFVIGYRPNYDGDNHFLPGAGFGVSVFYRDHMTNPATTASIWANGQTLASWNWSDTSALSGLVVTFSTMAIDATTASYVVQFSNASATFTDFTGGLSGTFTPSNATTDWTIAMHDQYFTSGGGTVLLDSIRSTPTSPAVPEPATYAELCGVSALGFVFIRRRRGQ